MASFHLFCSLGLTTLLWAAFVNAKCDETESEKVTHCFQPLIDLSQQQPEAINSVSFPLFHFKASGLRSICRLYNKAKTGCLEPLSLQESCKNHSLIKIFGSLFDYACDPMNEAKIFRHYGCIASTLEDSANCDSHLKVPESPGPSWDKCKNIPKFYACIVSTVTDQCGRTAQMMLRDTIRMYGCHNVESKALASAVSSKVRRRPISNPNQEKIGDKTSDKMMSKMDGKMNEKMSDNMKVGMTDMEKTKMMEEKKMMDKDQTSENDMPKLKGDKMPDEKMDMKKMPSKNQDMTTKGEMKMPKCALRSMPKYDKCFEAVADIYGSYMAKMASSSEGSSYPLFLFPKKDLLKLCDTHASTYLKCRGTVYKQCRDEPEVQLAGSLLSIGCGKPTAFFKALACMEAVRKRAPGCLPRFTYQAAGPKCTGRPGLEKCLMEVEKMDAACRVERKGKTAAQFILDSLSSFKC